MLKFPFSLSNNRRPTSMTSTQQKVMDVVFLIDATGSMSSTIRAAHKHASERAVTLRERLPDVNFQFGSICYRDPIDCPSDTHELHHLTSDIASLVSFFASVEAKGGGDRPEDWAGAYSLALNAMKWRDGAKTIIHIADAPAHGKLYCGKRNHEEEATKLRPMIETVAKRGILMCCIDINCGAGSAFNVCKAIYETAGGCKFGIEGLSLHRGRGRGSEMVDCDDALDDEEGWGEGEMDEDDVVGKRLFDCTDAACDDALNRFYA